MAAPPPEGVVPEAFVRDMYDFTLAPRDVLNYREHGRILQIEPLVGFEPEEFADLVDARTYWRQSVKSIFLFHEEAGLRLYETLRKECPTCGGLRIEWRLATQDKTLEARFPGECVFDLKTLRMHAGLACIVAPPVYSYYHEMVASGAPTLFVPLRGKLEEANRRAGPLLAPDNAALVKRIQDGGVPEPRQPTKFTGGRQAAMFLRQYLANRPPRKLLARAAKA
jgi:hypothetical protein